MRLTAHDLRSKLDRSIRDEPDVLDAILRSEAFEDDLAAADPRTVPDLQASIDATRNERATSIRRLDR